MVKIKEIRAFAITQRDGRRVLQETTRPRTEPRRAPWTKDAEVAGPMSGYARFKRLRSTWRFDGSVGVLVTADDGTTGFGVTRGQPVSASSTIISRRCSSARMRWRPIAAGT